jgi:hypothetical protein
MKNKLTIICLFLTLTALGQNGEVNRVQYQNKLIKVDLFNVPFDSNEFYFPIQSFPKFTYNDEYKDSSTILISEFTFPDLYDHSVLITHRTYSQIVPNQFDTSRQKWYSKYLFAMNEPLLFNSPTTTESYRFTWLRTFHHPISIRIEKTNDTYWLYLKVNSGYGGYYPGIIKKNKTKKITQEQWEGFQELLTSYDFWNKRIVGTLPSSDGSHWILEGSTPKYYLVLDRKSPRDSTDYFKVCDYLIELSKVKLKRDEKY